MIYYAEDKPLAELFNVQPEDYADISVLSLPFSVRVLNRFRSHKIESIRDLLSFDIVHLKRIQGFGANSLSQVLLFCEELSKQAGRLGTNNSSNVLTTVSSIFKEHKDAIVLGDFSFADDQILSEEQTNQLTVIKDAYVILGEELVFDCVYTPARIIPIISALSNYVNRDAKIRKLSSICNQLPISRRNNSAKYYISAYTYSDEVRENLAKCYSSVDNELGTIVQTINAEDDSLILLAERFLKWCNYNLKEEIDQLFSTVYSNPRIQTVIEGRANNQTLNDLGEQLGLTRERVRQIEAKAKRVFGHQQAKIKIMSKIFADQNGQSVITLEDIEAVSGSNASALIYLLRSIDGSIFTYDHHFDAFVFGNNDLSSRILDFVDSLPDVLHKSDLAEALVSAQEEFDLDLEYVEKAIYEVYKSTGDVLHRSRLSLAKIYDAVLRKYFADGIHVYDDKEIELLRQYIYNDYGDIQLPSVNRAIAARISSICILSGRGVYIPKKEKWISAALAQKMLDFIMKSNSPILLIGNIFSVFEEELEYEGIDNRFFLQGVLRELFGDKLYFRRDYVSRDKGFTSIYSSIVAFIKESHYPVKKEELKEKFKGITDIVISFATSDSDILNYFGEYLHGSNLVIRETEKNYLADYLLSTMSDGDAHHIKDIYARINDERPELFSRNAVVGPYSAFSVLEYLFREQYQFSRPYIALNNVEIGSPFERLKELLYSKDVFLVSDISEFAKENHMSIQSYVELINSYNDHFLFQDIDTVSSIDEIGVNNDIAKEVETLICDEISDTMPIRDLHCISKFPKVNVLWNEWLIYSILKKWSSKLDVALSSTQLRQSIPLVSLSGKMDVEKYKDVTPASDRIKIDNMDNIDDLLADILVDDLLEES